ncbi:unnamed protein product [Caenorhabditis bovis]|uniref:Uncharacterized protein n=1 Tax=Caenorhabditis bovis TaxID=2654633 RepID=A0A8S1FAS3_9PELO|nr:unnamed protein product [Caenorhabditis bovis]
MSNTDEVTAINYVPTDIALAQKVAEMINKSRRAVIENLEDTKCENQRISDKEFVKDVCEMIGIKHERIYWDKVHLRQRLLIVEFKSDIDRNHFLKEFRKAARAVAPLEIPRARRDLTQEEEKILRRNRKLAYELNKREGKWIYHIDDILLVKTKNPNPKPFY